MKWYFWIILILALFLVLKHKVKKRGYLMKDRAGKKVSTKEFFQRWKSGIEGITPLQTARTNLMGNWITLTGIIAGMVVNALVRMEHQWWWIEIILIGSFILVGIQMITLFQKYWKLKRTDQVMKELENKQKKLNKNYGKKLQKMPKSNHKRLRKVAGRKS